MVGESESGEKPTGEESREALEAELEALKAELEERKSAAGARIRGVVAVILVVLTTLGIVASSLSWWVHSVAFDTDTFMGVVEPALASDEFTGALGIRLSEEAVTALDLETRFEERLSALDLYIREQLVEAIDPDPRILDLIGRLNVPRFADLAGPLSEAANERITTAIRGWVDSPAFQTLLLAAMTRGHEAAVALVTDDLESLENVYVDGDEVKWNAIPVVVSTLEFVIEEGLLGGEEITLPDFSDNPIASAAIQRLAQALDARVPDDLGQITVMTTDELQTLQDYGAAFDRAVWLLTILTVALFVVTLVVSPHRRRTLIQLAVATVIAIVVAGIAVRAAVNAIQEGIVSPERRDAVRTVLSQVQESAQSVVLGIVLIAVLVGVLAWFAGRPQQLEKWLQAGRRATDPKAVPSRVDLFVGRYFDPLAIAVVVLALLLVWVVGPNWLWGLVILAGVGVFVWYGMSARARYELNEEAEEEPEDEGLDEDADQTSGVQAVDRS